MHSMGWSPDPRERKNACTQRLSTCGTFLAGSSYVIIFFCVSKIRYSSLSAEWLAKDWRPRGLWKRCEEYRHDNLACAKWAVRACGQIRSSPPSSSISHSPEWWPCRIYWTTILMWNVKICRKVFPTDRSGVFSKGNSPGRDSWEINITWLQQYCWRELANITTVDFDTRAYLHQTRKFSISRINKSG